MFRFPLFIRLTLSFWSCRLVPSVLRAKMKQQDRKNGTSRPGTSKYDEQRIIHSSANRAIELGVFCAGGGQNGPGTTEGELGECTSYDAIMIVLIDLCTECTFSCGSLADRRTRFQLPSTPLERWTYFTGRRTWPRFLRP